MTKLKDTILDELQYTSQDLLIRNKSILDSTTKMLDSSARISRTLSKAATQCGCIKIYAEKQQIPKLTENLEEMQSHMQTHIEERYATIAVSFLKRY